MVRSLLMGTALTLSLTAVAQAQSTEAEKKAKAEKAIETNATGVIHLDTIQIQSAAPATAGTNTLTISAEDLARTNPVDLQDVFRDLPSVSVGSSIPASQKVYVHGIEETNLNVTIDGSKQNNKVFHHNSTNMIDPTLLKAVTVEVGVAPADAGPGALAGSIAYETKDAADLLEDGRNFGGFATGSWDFNSDTFIGGLGTYGRQNGFEYLGYIRYGDGNEFKAGNGQLIPGTTTNILSGLGKFAYEAESGDRFEISHERVRDHAPRPYRANAIIIGRPWEPVTRNYEMDSNNTVFSYSDTTPDGWWDPRVVLAYSHTKVATPVVLRNGADDPATGETGSFNGKVENNFAVDLGSIVAGVDFYKDRAHIDYFEDTSAERATNLGFYTQARLEPWQRTRLSFGARGDHQWFEGTDGSKWNNGGLSGNVSGEYDLIENMLIAKAGYSHVWAGIPLAENFIMNPNWDYGAGPEPVTSNNVTGGLEFHYEGLTLEGTLFRTDIKNARTPRYPIARGTEHHNVESKGFELGAKYDWVMGFASIRYADIDVNIDGEPADSDLGTYLATPIGQIITLGAGHNFADWGLTIGADVLFALDYDKVAPGNRPIDNYTVANIYAEYTPPSHPNFTLRGDVLNLFNETYASRASYGQEFMEVTPLLEPGITFKLSATARF